MLADKKQKERTVLAEYKNGFTVELRFMPRSKLRDLTDRAKIRKWQHHQLVESADDVKYSELVAKEVVVGWTGLTAAVLRQMVALDEYPEEVPFSVEDCAWLLREAYDFDVWVQQVSTEIEYFEAARRAAEQKNSSPSPASN